jgi:type VI protein secretion system component Hcp
MIKQQMIDNFGMNRKTLENWERNRQGEKRQFLYYVLKNLPIEQIREMKTQFEKEIKNELS